MAAFEYRQAEEIRDALERHGVRYLFIGKSGAILLGYPDTTQDADLFVEKAAANSQALVTALRELGFALTGRQAAEIVRGKDFVQLKNGPFDLDLVFAPDGIESFQDAFRRRVGVSGLLAGRHHRQQGGIEPGKGPRDAAAPSIIPRLPECPLARRIVAPA